MKINSPLIGANNTLFDSAFGETRTLNPLKETFFENVVYTIPPQRHGLNHLLTGLFFPGLSAINTDVTRFERVRLFKVLAP